MIPGRQCQPAVAQSAGWVLGFCMERPWNILGVTDIPSINSVTEEPVYRLHNPSATQLSKIGNKSP